MTLRVLIDAKNLALFHGGISAFSRPLFLAWMRARPDISFIVAAPPFDDAEFIILPNVTRHIIHWPDKWPRKLRHIIYDNFLFPSAVRHVSPQFIFSPYHDVRLPRKSSHIRSAMMILDTCFDDVPQVYSQLVRRYYLWMMRLNLRRADRVLTISQTSQQKIATHYGIASGQTTNIYNAVDHIFSQSSPPDARIESIRKQTKSAKRLFYASGIDARKNVPRLIAALQQLWHAGHDVVLLTTGQQTGSWPQWLSHLSDVEKQRIIFLGRLTLEELKLHYLACDAVVFPSLCEGFGRSILEAMMTGAPLACSDIPVFHEIAGEYANYFNPFHVEQMSQQILKALSQQRQRPVCDQRFSLDYMTSTFINAMNDWMKP